MNHDNRFTGLVVLFAVSLTAAQFLAAKVVAVGLPFDAPIVGSALVFPAGFFAYAFTYFATDCISELYGPAPAKKVVVYGFGGLVAVVGMMYAAIYAPISPAGVSQSAFASVVGSSTNVIIGGMAAYAVSQANDITLFHKIKTATDGRHLWLRNVASTSVSQAIDTVVFVGLAFWALPSAIGMGVALPIPVVLSLIVGQYVVKVFVAAADTPFVYAVTRNGWGIPPTPF